MLVKVAPLGEVVREVNVEDGSTVASILQTAGVEVNGRTVRLNNEEVDLDEKVTNGDTMENPHVLTLTTKMKGGR